MTLLLKINLFLQVAPKWNIKILVKKHLMFIANKCLRMFKSVGHGFWISSIIASDINDNRGIASHTKIKTVSFNYETNKFKPSLMRNIFTLLISLNNHKEEIKSTLDVINISSGVFLSDYDIAPVANNANSKLIYKSTNNSDTYLCNPLMIQASKDITDQRC